MFHQKSKGRQATLPRLRTSFDFDSIDSYKEAAILKGLIQYNPRTIILAFLIAAIRLLNNNGLPYMNI